MNDSALIYVGLPIALAIAMFGLGLSRTVRRSPGTRVGVEPELCGGKQPPRRRTRLSKLFR